jgi:hypothetical protein
VLALVELSDGIRRREEPPKSKLETKYVRDREQRETEEELIQEPNRDVAAGEHDKRGADEDMQSPSTDMEQGLQHEVPSTSQPTVSIELLDERTRGESIFPKPISTTQPQAETETERETEAAVKNIAQDVRDAQEKGTDARRARFEQVAEHVKQKREATLHAQRVVGVNEAERKHSRNEREAGDEAGSSTGEIEFTQPPSPAPPLPGPPGDAAIDRKFSPPINPLPLRIAQQSQPTFAKIHRSHLDIDTLHYYDIPYEYDLVS